jgi:hypothetical protein
MSARSSKIFCLSLSGFILLLTLALLLPRQPAVTLRFCGFQTNRSPASIFSTSDGERVSAIIEVTNCSRRAVSYRAYQKPEYADYICLHQIGGCWTNYDSGFRCGTGASLSGWTWRQFRLEPSQTFTFQAHMWRPQAPCRVGMAYYPVQATNGIYRVLPSWVVQRLPWRKEVCVAATDAFKL